MAVPSTKMPFLRGESFKIILKDVIPAKITEEEEQEPEVKGSATAPPKTGTTSGSATRTDTTVTENPPEYIIHKSLLSSLSPELYKHANNEMKEGRDNVIELSEVDEPTIEAFLEWAYYQEYGPVPDIDYSLLAHTKIYVLADRFNIPRLKDLSFSKISTLLANKGMVQDRTEIQAITDAVTYASENLPLYGGLSTRSGTQNPGFVPATERLLKYFAQYIAWALQRFRFNDEFIKLLPEHPDLLEVVLSSCRPAATPPWKLNPDSVLESASHGTDLSEMITVNRTNQDHILHRRCGNCSHIGLMGIKCGSCSRYDWEIGLEIKFQEAYLGTLHKGRLSGTKTNFTYNCRWCNNFYIYNTTSASFSHNGSSYTAARNVGYLWCRDCHTPGFQYAPEIVS